MHKLKALGLCLVAVFAMSAMAASAAQADLYHAESAPGWVHGESSDNVFTITHSPENLEVKCTKATVFGEFKEVTPKTLTVHPTYSGCELNEIPASVNTASCNYKFSEPSSTTTITVGILNCPSTAPIKITSTGCTVEVTETSNSALSHIILSDQGSGTTRDVFANITIAGITAKQSSGCPGGAGTFATADYNGTFTVKGYTNSAHTIQQGIWVA